MAPVALDQDVQRQVVTLNGKTYRILGGVRTQQAGEFAPQITTGAQNYDKRENVSQFVMTSWTGGAGLFRAHGSEAAGRYWFSTGMDPRFANQLTLGPLRQQLG